MMPRPRAEFPERADLRLEGTTVLRRHQHHAVQIVTKQAARGVDDAGPRRKLARLAEQWDQLVSHLIPYGRSRWRVPLPTSAPGPPIPGAMTTLAEKVVVLHHALDGAGLPHAFGGALALGWCTQQPRGTADIDLNVFTPTTEVRAVLDALPG